MPGSPRQCWPTQMGQCVGQQAIESRTSNGASDKAVPPCPLNQCPTSSPDFVKWLNYWLNIWNTLCRRGQLTREQESNMENGGEVCGRTTVCHSAGKQTMDQEWGIPGLESRLNYQPSVIENNNHATSLSHKTPFQLQSSLFSDHSDHTEGITYKQQAEPNQTRHWKELKRQTCPVSSADVETGPKIKGPHCCFHSQPGRDLQGKVSRSLEPGVKMTRKEQQKWQWEANSLPPSSQV